MTSKTPYGAPLLSPMNSETCSLMSGKHGQLQIKALPDADTFGLFYLASEAEGEPARDWTLLACHPNGHSCKELANRILAAWAGKGDGARAIDQFDFILRCGGLGRSLETILNVIRGQY